MRYSTVQTETFYNRPKSSFNDVTVSA